LLQMDLKLIVSSFFANGFNFVVFDFIPFWNHVWYSFVLISSFLTKLYLSSCLSKLKWKLTCVIFGSQQPQISFRVSDEDDRN
jgi:hypothetical protein